MCSRLLITQLFKWHVEKDTFYTCLFWVILNIIALSMLLQIMLCMPSFLSHDKYIAHYLGSHFCSKCFSSCAASLKGTLIYLQPPLKPHTQLSLLDIKACSSINEQLWFICNFLKIEQDNIKKNCFSEMMNIIINSENNDFWNLMR